MEFLCPLCNGMSEYIKYCSKCGSIMKNGGRIQDYYDDYSPYLSFTITDVLNDEPSGVCEHIYTCPVCKNDSIVEIKKEYF